MTVMLLCGAGLLVRTVLALNSVNTVSTSTTC